MRCAFMNELDFVPDKSLRDFVQVQKGFIHKINQHARAHGRAILKPLKINFNKVRDPKLSFSKSSCNLKKF